jgi:hypothetical protein
MASGREILGGRTSARVGLGVAVLLLASGMSWTHAAGRCISVDVPQPVVMPDQSVHEGGALRLCLAREYSPVASIHKTYINGLPTGMLTSRDGRSEGPAEPEPYVLFRKIPGERLELIGYAWPKGEKMETYILSERFEHVAAVQAAAAPGAAERMLEGVVLLAARVE